MKIKVINVFKLTNPPQNILDVEIIEGDYLSRGKTFISDNMQFTIESVGLVNPPINKSYPVIVSIQSDLELSDLKDKIFTESD